MKIAKSPKLVYAASPTRIIYKKEEIMNFISHHGCAGLHPFNSFPFHYYEGGMVGRDITMQWCCRLIDICDELWMFGLSEGTLMEFSYFINQRKKSNFKVYIKEFDSDWEEYLKEYKNKFKKIFPLLKLKY